MSTDTFEIEALDQPTFTQVGHWVAFRTDLSPTARHLYTVLATFVNQGRRASGDTDVWPSLNLLAVTLGLSKGKSVTPYMDELIQANIVVKTSNTIGGMRSRNTYGIRFNPPPGEKVTTSFAELLEPLKEIADDPKAMTKVSAETRELIKERRARESAKRTGRPVVPDSGLRRPASGTTYSRIGDRNKTQGELDGGRTTRTSSSSAGAPAEPERSEAPTKKTKMMSKSQEREQAKTLIAQRLPDSTNTEQDAIIDLVYAEAATKGTKIGFITSYIGGRPDSLLEQDLAQVRRYASAPPPGALCSEHDLTLALGKCASCEGDMNTGDFEVVRKILERDGAGARPDLARRIGAPQVSAGHVPFRNPVDQSVYDEELCVPSAATDFSGDF